jgi:hypothetical protein
VQVADGSGGVDFAAPLTIAASSSAFASLNAQNELVIDNLLIGNIFVSTETSIANYLANDAQASNTEGGDLVVLAGGGGTWGHVGTTNGDATDYVQTSSAGSFNSFSVAADSGTPATIIDGETFSVLGATGLTSNVAGDVVTVSLSPALAGLASAPTTPGSYVVTHDGAGNYGTADASTLNSSLGTENQTLTAARTVIQAANALTFTQGAGESILFSGAGITTTGTFESTVAEAGMILKSADGSRFRIGINNVGALTSTAL